MANRTPTSHEDDQTMPAWTAPQPGSYQWAGPGTRHRHDGGRAEDHAQGDRPHYHDDGPGGSRIVVFFGPAAPAPTGAATKADPTPAGIPDGSQVPSEPSGDAGSDAAGSGRPPRARDEHGRFIGTSRLTAAIALPVSVALEHALIEYDADHFLEMQHYKLRMARVLLDAIRFGVEADRLETALAVKAGMLVRLGHDGGGS